MKKILKDFIWVILLLVIIAIVFGCDFMKCRPDGKVDKEGNPTYIGFKCNGEW